MQKFKNVSNKIRLSNIKVYPILCVAILLDICPILLHCYLKMLDLLLYWFTSLSFLLTLSSYRTSNTSVDSNKLQLVA